jgi:type II secretory pathway component PulK
LSVTSNYFLLHGTATIAEQSLQAQMLIQRNHQQAAVIRRSFGQNL